jgi:type VI secretion system lysozyme-like protein
LKVDPQSKRVVASIVDRLLLVDDDQQRRLNEYDVDELRHDVRRSLETLLNARQAGGVLSDELKCLAESVHQYGIPDFTEMGWGGKEQLRDFCKRVERAIATFEPRLVGPRVELIEQGGNVRDRILRFRIRAWLHVRPHPQEVVYDSVVDPTTHEIEVRTA